MINKFSLLQSVGQFHQVTTGDMLPLNRLALLYAENGRGKTTIASIFRSLAANDPVPVTERLRFGSTHPLRVTLAYTPTGSTTETVTDFTSGNWSAVVPDLAIFDDHFVADNVYSGVQVNSDHRDNLHDLILGSTGVALNTDLQKHVDAIEAHNRRLRDIDTSISLDIRNGLTIEKFCSLPFIADIEKLIETASKSLAAAKSSAEIVAHRDFKGFSFPTFDVHSINAVLSSTLASIDAKALAAVASHTAKIGVDHEQWASTGLSMIQAASEGLGYEACPFCEQNLKNSSLIDQYRMFFNHEYEALKTQLNTTKAQLQIDHSTEEMLAFERAVAAAQADVSFWNNYIDVPRFSIDTVKLSNLWKTAVEATISSFNNKQSSPLEDFSLSVTTLAAIQAFHAAKELAIKEFDKLANLNVELAEIRLKAKTADLPKAMSYLAHCKAAHERHKPSIKSLADAYVTEAAAKKKTENLRKAAREGLETYRTTVFPAYHTAINSYLSAFGAQFSLGQVSPINHRTGSSCNYSILVDRVPVSLDAPTGNPSFRTALSAGDRSTLALAFFFASLDMDPNLANKIIVIDDPMTSLDEHRTLATAEHIRSLVSRVKQVIVLSHSKPFLLQVWKDMRRDQRSALLINRSTAGSDLVAWNVNDDCITDHDRRFDLVTRFIAGSTQPSDKQKVAEALRPMLECFLRVSYSYNCPSGTLLGEFLDTCRAAMRTVPILSQKDIDELNNLRSYGNRFHHDNDGYSTAPINDGELLGYAVRTLNFIKRT